MRRYPDLLVHRILKAVLEKEGGSARVEAASARHRPAGEGLPSLPAPVPPGAWSRRRVSVLPRTKRSSCRAEPGCMRRSFVLWPSRLRRPNAAPPMPNAT
ncbi:MAG: hypothetical protein MUP80_15280 [Acidobacteriia bacterium]|nr:hypothetical protein [Terriglobia bacterium]